MSKLTNNIDYRRYHRFFAFGCSFTNYFWPTWADIIATEISDSYNYGMCGGGNGFIFNRVIEANQRHKFGEHDLIMIMWTNSAREDRYFSDNWQALGNIYSQDSKSIYTPDLVKKIACDRGYYIRDVAYITAIKKIIECSMADYDMLSVVSVEQGNINRPGVNRHNNDVTALYSDTLSSIRPSVYETIYDSDWSNNPRIKAAFWSDNPIEDFHPNPDLHLEYLKYTYPDIEITSNMRTMLYNEMTKIRGLPYITKTNYVYNRRGISKL